MTLSMTDLFELMKGAYAEKLKHFKVFYKDNRVIVLTLEVRAHQNPFADLRKVLSGIKKAGVYLYTKTDYIDGVYYIHLSTHSLSTGYDSKELIRSVTKYTVQDAFAYDLSLGELRQDRNVYFKPKEDIYWECWGKPQLVFHKGETYKGIKHSNGFISACSDKHRMANFVSDNQITILD